MIKSIIISGALAQDHEFIYPFYRLLEANSEVEVCLIGGKPVQGILGTTLPPNKAHPVKDIDMVKVENYDLAGVDNLEEATIIGTPSWYTINLKYQTKIDKNLVFIAGIHNIMDIHYKPFGSGISASGRNFSLTLQATF